MMTLRRRLLLNRDFSQVLFYDRQPHCGVLPCVDVTSASCHWMLARRPSNVAFLQSYVLY